MYPLHQNGSRFQYIVCLLKINMLNIYIDTYLSMIANIDLYMYTHMYIGVPPADGKEPSTGDRARGAYWRSGRQTHVV